MAERVLVVEDDRELRSLLVEILRDARYEAEPFPTADAALRALTAGAPADVVISDLVMPGMPGVELVRVLRRTHPELNVIALTAFGTIDSAIELIRAGAFDYLTKPVSADDLLAAVQRALGESRLRRQLATATRPAASGGPPGFIGSSPAMREVYDLLPRAAASRHPVLITGESGRGKELVARTLHELSGRAPFVTVNCGAIPENLLESELFGHEKGAFTGADRPKEGLFEAAHAGTLFLDEIGELPLVLQPKLLRALEQAEIRRVGATQPRAVDIRVIAATNRDLEAEIEAGTFREDLFWRLDVLTIHVPALREHPEDIPALAEHFLAEAVDEHRRSTRLRASDRVPRALSPDALALLVAYAWPGNVRELRNAVARAVALAVGDVIEPGDLPQRIRLEAEAASVVAEASRQQLSLRDLERLYVLEVLRTVGGNKSRAADILGLDRKTLYRRLEEYRSEDPPQGE